MAHEYEAPYKLMAYEPALSERLLSLFVYSGRVRLERAPGEPFTVEELKEWVAKRGLPRGYLLYMGICVADVLKELRRPRPTLVKS
jgi:hypothetical protein